MPSVTSRHPADLEPLLRAFDGDVELLRELVDTFLGDCPARLDELREALAAGDVPRTARAAHTLKGSVANFGAHDASALALEIETAARQGELAAHALAPLEAELARVTAYLSAHAREEIV